MVKEIQISVRGCGERKEGGLYLVGDYDVMQSPWYPRELKCQCGIQHLRESRNCQAFKPAVHFPESHIKYKEVEGRRSCPHHFHPDEDHLLITIGAQFYPTPEDYLNEARKDGFSRLIQQIPHALKVGKTRVFLIHPKAFKINVEADGQTSLFGGRGTSIVYEPGVIASYLVRELQYVVRGDESEAELKRRIAAGQTPVKPTYV